MDKRKFLEFLAFLVIMVCLMPWTPLLRTSTGERYLLIGVLGAYGFAVLILFLLLVQKNFSKKNYLAAVGGLGLIFLLVSCVAEPSYTVEKLHYLQYMLIYHMGLRVFPLRTAGREAMAFIITLGVGISDEILQVVLPDRIFDMRDIFINTKGAVLGLLTSVIHKNE